MRHWFFPRLSGDFRLERQEGDTSLLTVEDPTAQDKVHLKPFLDEIKRRGLVDELVGLQPKGVTRIEIPAPIAVLGPLLGHTLHGDDDAWTVIRHASNKMTLNDGFDMLPIEKSEEPVAAATVQPPMQGCPAPAPANRRASQVLRTFCTQSQWDEFQRHGRLTARGNATGRKYHVYHRDEASRLRLSHSLVQVSDQQAICTWDDRVPAEEEILGIKLAVEHREAWLLGMGTAPAAPLVAKAHRRYRRI